METRITIEKINDVEAFFRVVDTCESNVELCTGEGDCLNLKSKLSQYLSMTRMFSDGDVPDMELVVGTNADAKKLRSFLQRDARLTELLRRPVAATNCVTIQHPANIASSDHLKRAE